MHKTTSSRHYSSPTLLLLFLLVLTGNANSTGNNKKKDEAEEQVEPDLNLTWVDIHNDLPPNSQYLFVTGSFQVTEALIERGKSYHFIAGGKPENGSLIIGTQDMLYVHFQTFDPRIDLGRRFVYWSARNDGVYRSWDQSNWRKVSAWQK